jgi:HK97 family phage portal protein
MGFWQRALGIPEKRMMTDTIGLTASFPGIERQDADLLKIFGLNDISLPAVSIESALHVPAVWAAVSFLSRTLAALPLHAYSNKAEGPQKIVGGLETLIHEAPNKEWTSFKLRQHFWQQVFTGGRGLLYIERSGSNIVSLWPIDPLKVQIKRKPNGETTYLVNGEPYSASDIIDVPFMLRSDGLRHYSPITQGAETIQLALAMTRYGAKFFAGGGVPPLGLFGPMPTGPEAMKRALADVNRAVEEARASTVPIVQLPPGYELKPIAFDPNKGQMVEGQRFCVEQIARIFGLPPVFLQDLTNATFTNSEQQSLQLVKFVIVQWVQSFEEELNLKLFGQRNGGRYVEHVLDGLLRGDFLGRMQALGQAIQNGLLTPNEGRAIENRPAKPNGDDLMIQGATVPIGSQLKAGENSANNDGNDGGNNVNKAA